jgi:hypothetical protein
VTLIADKIILGASVSRGAVGVPKAYLTEILALLENQAKSKATRSKV